MKLATSFGLLVIVGACAATPERVDATDRAESFGADALAGCRLQPGPVALCDDGKVVLDVATSTGTPAERIEYVHSMTDRPDDAFQLEAGEAKRTADGAVTRVDTLHPWHVTSSVGKVTFFAPSTGTAVVSCASFGGAKVDPRCRERSLALLAKAVDPTATLQHRPVLDLPALEGCAGTDEPLALQRLCKSGEKLSIVGIRGSFGPAAAWWLFHRVVLSNSSSVRLVTTCPVFGQNGPCSLVDVPKEGGERPVLFGLAVERDEMRIAGCFFGSEAQRAGIPPGCLAAFSTSGTPPGLRLIHVANVPYVPHCELSEPDIDGFSRSILCEDGSSVSQLDDDDLVEPLVKQLANGAELTPPTNVPCVVRGAPASCSLSSAGDLAIWRADVVDPRVRAFVCTTRTNPPTPPEVCDGFIDAAP